MIEIVPYQPRWPEEFRALGGALRSACGEAALAIHHIGSTSVPGLAAKDVIDVQLTVRDLEAVPTAAIIALGYGARPDITSDHQPPGLTLPGSELTKRYFSRSEPHPVHLHVREVGRFNQRYPLLCRDFLRASSGARDAYAEIKRQLARYFPNDVEAYYDIKDPVFDLLMAGAERWAEQVGWQPPETDA